VNLVAALVLAQTVVSIDAAANRHRINPNVYGVNFATQAQLTDLNVPLNRSGGNTTTRYNWQQNCAGSTSRSSTAPTFRAKKPMASSRPRRTAARSR
jgi:hypothetical protein